MKIFIRLLWETKKTAVEAVLLQGGIPDGIKRNGENLTTFPTLITKLF